MTAILVVEAFVSGFVASLQGQYTGWHLVRLMNRLERHGRASYPGGLRHRIWHLWL